MINLKEIFSYKMQQGCDELNTNAIEKIRAAELQAEQAEKTAEENALKTVENAKNEAKVILNKAKNDGEMMVEKAIGSANEQAAAKSAEIASENKEVLKNLENAVNAKKDAAIELIKKKLISE